MSAAADRIEDIYPLSPMQEGILFHCLYAPESALYFQQVGFTLDGELDGAALRDAWQQVVERHPVLRTGFVWENRREPLQVVYRSVQLPWSEEDWRGHGDEEQSARLAARLAAERRQGFVLSRAPLVRFALLRLRDRRYRFVWNLHHLVLDGWSVPEVLREVFELYEALSGGGPAPRWVERQPFSAYIAWLRAQDTSGAEAFWRRSLAGIAVPTALCSRPAAGAASGHGEVVIALDPRHTAAAQALARRNGLTLNTLVQGAWALLLSRSTGEGDVLFGASVSGRGAPLPGIESMIGLFINTLPVRVGVPEDEPLVDWLAALQRDQLELRRHEHVSLVQVHGWSEVPRGRPLFESIVVFENFPVDASLGHGRNGLRVLEVEAFQNTNYALTLLATGGPRLSLRLLFDRALLAPAAAVRVLEQMRTLLAEMTAGPLRLLREISPLSAAERHQILTEWNDSAGPGSPFAALHEAFESQAARHPSRVAVVAGEVCWTYEELNRRANRLARRLRSLGVAPNLPVAVCMDRSADMVAALLAITKAGGFYVPIEPAYPDSRVHWILSTLGVRWLITQQRWLPRITALAAGLPELRHLLACDGGEDDLEMEQADNLPPWSGPDDSAYVIFTSGSTGSPKGVLVRHRPALDLIDWVSSAFAVGPHDRVLLVASLCFDLSVYDIFGLLAAGGSIQVASEAEVRDPGRLLAFLAGGEVTFWDSAPAALQQLAFLLPEAPLDRSRLRLVFLSGDWIPVALPDVLRRSFPGARVIGLGGATEATVWSNYFPIGEVDPRWASIPYGRPIRNARYHVLDRRLEPCAVGVEGDLFIGGGCLASGYAGEPVLTAEKFVPDPFGGVPGAVLYRTGDRARYGPDGNLEFLGRRDAQVKVRGFRIELEEIETVLGEHEEVRHAAVLAQADSGGDRRLVAFVVPIGLPGPAAADLRRFLAARLPQYMIPAFFVLLESLPITPNGKLDRKALAALDSGRPPEEERVAPRTPVEEMVAGLWEEVLGVERVGVTDDFFELGGHSLVATRLASRLRQAFQVELPLRQIFERPTVAALARALEEDRQGENVPAAPPLLPVPRGADLPVAFAQQRLWFLDQMEPGSPAYNIPSSVRLRGELRIPFLCEALDALVRRHETLRTTIPAVDGRPCQRIAPAAPRLLPVVDLCSLTGEQRDAEVQDLARREAAVPFDLARGPLLRTALLQLAADDHVVLLTMHHIVSDGWSMGIFVQELARLYQALQAGRPADLPEPTLQYADFACWQREWLQGEALEAQLAYWRRCLDGLPAALDLPVDHPRLPGRAGRSAFYSTVLPGELTDSLRRRSRQEGGSLFMTLLAAFGVLLARLSGQTDLAVGTPVAGRNRAETEGIIGFFVNTLVLRLGPSGSLSFRDLLRQVREVALEAYARQDLPFEKLVEELQPRRDTGRTPLFQVFFNMLNLPATQIPLQGLTLQAASYGDPGSKFELTLYAAEREGRMAFDWSYDASLFDRERVAEMARQLAGLLARAAAYPEERIESWPLLTTEAAALLPDPRAPLPERWQAAAHQLFAGQAAHRPERTAVVDTHGAWSYGLLDRQSARLANRLRAAGLGTGDVVAVYACRGASLIWALLGVLRAGAAFLILDAGYPGARLAGYVAAARPRGWLDLTGAGPLPDALAVQVDSIPLACRLALPERLDEPVLDSWPEESPRLPVQPGDLAYVAFTSGSTGRPKGILGGHGPLAHFLEWHAGRFGLGAADRFSLLSGLSHDPLLRDVFTPLSVGAALHVPAADLLRDPQGLRAWMARVAVTVAHLTPAQAQILCDEAGPGPLLPALRYAFFGGAVLSYRLAGRLRLLAPSVACVNFYGATETPQAMAALTLPPGEGEGGEAVPLGHGIEGAQILVLRRAGERLDLAGVGEPGEICVRTPYLSQGYLGEPEATAERFVANPFTGVPADLLYRTGDLGRYRPDGTVDFLGRTDDQVNLRGYRIEPAEVEAALERHAAVRQALVLAWPQEPAPPAGDTELRLVAYVIAGPLRPTARELRQYLLELLPEAMVPSAFVLLEALPLTPNGKIDRRQLWELAVEEDTPRPGRGPRSPLEEVLAAIWSELLPARPVGMDDDFFELGGHSLLATQLVSRVRHAAGVELSLADFFAAPSMAGMARLLEARLRGTDLQEPPLLPVPRGSGIPLSSAQRRLWFLERLNPGDPAYSMPTALRLSGRLDVVALERALNEIVRRHESLRTSFVEVDRSPLQIVVPAAVVVLPVIDLSGLGEGARQAETARIGRAEIRKPFDLARPPLLRAALVRLGPEEHTAFFAMHHIVSDGWSMGILVRETTELYVAYATGAPPSLPDLPVQYADYAAWQQRWFSGEVREAQLSYWLRQMEGVPPLLDLPGDNSRPPVQTSRGALMGWTFPERLLPALQELQRRERVTLFMILLAAFQVQMRWYCGQDDFVVGTDVANRNRLEAEGMIGFFVNQLPLRARLSGVSTFSEVLRQARTTTLEAYSNQDLPFDTLVESLRLERSLAYSPLIQVKLNLLSFARPHLRLPGLTLSPLDLPLGAAKLDMIVDLFDVDGILRGTCQYRSDLFKEATIRRFWQHFQTLLEQITARPDLEVGELERSLADSDREAQALARNRFQQSRSRMLQARIGTGPLRQKKL